jgi:hypothetical protein
MIPSKFEISKLPDTLNNSIMDLERIPNESRITKASSEISLPQLKPNRLKIKTIKPLSLDSKTKLEKF